MIDSKLLYFEMKSLKFKTIKVNGSDQGPLVGLFTINFNSTLDIIIIVLLEKQETCERDYNFVACARATSSSSSTLLMNSRYKFHLEVKKVEK